MLIENTGSHMLDSGGAYGRACGRAWQTNQKSAGILPEDSEDVRIEKAIALFDKEPESWSESWETDKSKPVPIHELITYYSMYHHLLNQLELDEVCEAFNKLPCEDWDGDAYGTSTAQTEWLKERGFHFGQTVNSYNYENDLNGVIQFTYLAQNKKIEESIFDLEYDDNLYVLLQVHGGCDVQGGYTDAKLFRYWLDNDGQGYLGEPDGHSLIEYIPERGEESLKLDLPKEYTEVKDWEPRRIHWMVGDSPELETWGAKEFPNDMDTLVILHEDGYHFTVTEESSVEHGA